MVRGMNYVYIYSHRTTANFDEITQLPALRESKIQLEQMRNGEDNYHTVQTNEPLTDEQMKALDLYMVTHGFSKRQYSTVSTTLDQEVTLKLE